MTSTRFFKIYCTGMLITLFGVLPCLLLVAAHQKIKDLEATIVVLKQQNTKQSEQIAYMQDESMNWTTLVSKYLDGLYQENDKLKLTNAELGKTCGQLQQYRKSN